MQHHSLFRTLTEQEVAEFRAAARALYTPFTDINELFHPVYRAECELMNAEYVQARGNAAIDAEHDEE